MEDLQYFICIDVDTYEPEEYDYTEEAELNFKDEEDEE